MEYNCKRCRNLFRRTVAEANRGRTKFCSRECSDSYKKERAILHAQAVLAVGKKQCKACSETKPLHEFPPSIKSATGYFSYCIECRKEINRAQDEKRWSNKKDILIRQRRNANYRREYGITIDEYENLLIKQNNGCAICGTKSISKYHAVDHDHETGTVRGILCENCNRGIGMFKDDEQLLLKAIAYLKSYK